MAVNLETRTESNLLCIHHLWICFYCLPTSVGSPFLDSCEYELRQRRSALLLWRRSTFLLWRSMFFWNENVQEYYSYVAARGGWRTGADHELESRPIGLMRCGHSFLLCPASFPLGQSNHTQCSAAAPDPLVRSSVLVHCACVACMHPSWCWCVQLQTYSAAFEFETAQPRRLARPGRDMHALNLRVRQVRVRTE